MKVGQLQEIFRSDYCKIYYTKYYKRLLQEMITKPCMCVLCVLVIVDDVYGVLWGVRWCLIVGCVVEGGVTSG